MPATGLLCKQPPYGGIRAVDLRTGRTIWDRPLAPRGSTGRGHSLDVAVGHRHAELAGGHHFMKMPRGDHAIAYALPQKLRGRE